MKYCTFNIQSHRIYLFISSWDKMKGRTVMQRKRLELVGIPKAPISFFPF